MATHRQRRDSEEWRMCIALDDLDDFDKYEASILPLLRRAIAEKWNSSRIRVELASFSQALIVQQALLGNVGRSSQLAAIKDALNRLEGLPQRRIRRTQQEALTREELIELAYKKLLAAGVIR